VSIVNFEVVHCPLCGSGEAYPVLEWRARRMVRCNRCSLLYRNPRPTASDIRGAYAAERTSLGWEERVADRRSHQFRRFVDSYPDRPGRLLDIGTGYGFFLKMAEERGWEAIGVDLDPKGIAYAKERLRVNAVLGDLEDVHLPEGSFDLVTLWNVVECVPDPLELLRQVRPLLRKEGTVFIRTQNEVWQRFSFRLTSLLPRFGWKTLFEGRPFPTFVFHVSSFSCSTLRCLLEQAGFFPLSIENSEPTQGDPYLGLGSAGERMITVAKRSVHGLAQAAYLVSGGRWVIGPSLDAWAQRRQIQDNLVRVQRETAKGEESGESVDAV
jgi:SAM-dependent methyltransferase